MATLGDAWVVIRAITTQLKGDVKKGLDDAAQEADSSAAKTGENYSKTLGQEIEKGIEKDVGSRISEGLSKGYKDSDGDRDGKSLSSKILKGFLGGLAAGAKGVGPALLQGIGFAAIGGGIAGLVGGAVGGITDLAAGLTALIGPLSQASTLLGVGLVAGFGALIQGAALSTMWLKDLTASAKNVPPAAAAARKEFQAFQTQFKNLVATVGTQTVFPALQQLFHQLATGSLPLMDTAIRSTGQAIAGIITQFTGMLKNPLFSGNLNTVFQTNATSIHNLGSAFLSIVQAMTAVLAVASPLINEFTGWIKTLAEHAAASAAAGQATGKMSEFFGQAAQIIKTVGGLLSNLYGIIHSVTSAAGPLGSALLLGWKGGAEKLNEYLKSAQGVKALGNFFNPNGQVVSNLRSIGDAVKVAAGGFAVLAQNAGIQQFFDGLTQVLPGVIKFLNSATTAIGQVGGAIGTAFASSAGAAGVQAMSQGVQALGGAFTALAPVIGPLLQIVGNLVTEISQGLAPGFRAIAQVMPQLVGPFSQLGTTVGTVLGDALRAIAPLLPQIAQALASIATIVASSLNTAVTIAGGLLKGLLDILNPILKVLSSLAPFVSALATAFIAWKVLGPIGDTIKAMGGFMQFASQAGGEFATTIGRAGTALAGIGAALPLVGTALIAVSSLWTSSNNQINDWTQALITGGQAAVTAEAEMSRAHSTSILSSEGIRNFGSTVSGAFADGAAQLEGYSSAADKANKQMQQQLDNMTPLARAQTELNTATANYDQAVGDLGPNSMLAIGYHQQMHYWAGQVTQATIEDALAHGQLSQAVGLVSQQMYGELAAHQALMGASQATQSAVLGLETAQSNLLDTQKQFPANSLQVQQSQLGVQQAVQSVIATASQSAQTWADQAVKAGKFTDDANGMAKAVTAGMQLQRDQLQQLADAIPAGALHDAVQGAIDQFTTLGKLQATPTVNSPDLTAFNNGAIVVDKTMAGIDGLKATPIVGLPDIGPPSAAIQAILDKMKVLDTTRATAQADLDPTDLTNGLITAQAGLTDLQKQNPTPRVGLDAGPFGFTQAQVKGQLANLDSQNPTPKVGLDPDAYHKTQSQILGELFGLGKQTANPAINAVDHASGTIGAIQAQLLALRDRSVTITTVERKLYAQSNAGPALAGGGAIGGILGFAQGGLFPSLFNPMAAGIANIVAPNTWRVIGDRLRDDEAYIPINNSSRSRQILQQTATRMGYLLAAPEASAVTQTASTPSSGAYIPVTVYPAAQMDEAALGRKVGQEIAWQLRKI